MFYNHFDEDGLRWSEKRAVVEFDTFDRTDAVGLISVAGTCMKGMLRGDNEPRI